MRKHRVVMTNAVSIPYCRAGVREPWGYAICMINLASHRMLMADKMTIMEKRLADELFTNKIVTTPNSTRLKEKNTFVARMAATSSVASGAMYEYHLQILGTKKCQRPNAIVIILPSVANILLMSIIVYPLNYLQKNWYFI
jgi:hypothetical protein